MLAGLRPDQDRLRRGCERLGLLGCCVYSRPTPAGALAARMFASAIGVPEDIANANGTGCLAARLARTVELERAALVADAQAPAPTAWNSIR